MVVADAESDNRRRTRVIERYDVRDAPIRPELQAIVELAARICSTPMATINLLTDTEQFHVAAYGIDPMVCRLEEGMCHTVLSEPTPLVVADCSVEPRFVDHPFVNGEVARLRFYASHQLRTPGGVVIGTLCVYDDEIRELDHEQIKALGTLAERVVDVLELSLRSRQLEASNDRLTAFAERVTHDLKSPLASVTLSLGLLQEQLTSTGEVLDPDQAGWLLDRATRGSRRMTTMIEQILQHAATGSLDLVGVDLDRVADSVLEELPDVPGGVEVVRTPLPTVRGDETQLRTVLQNLIDNAVKYRHPDRPLRIELHAVEQAASCRVQVTDNGIGIPAGQRERVFEPRVRISSSAHAVEGSGIGLDTTRRVIRDHGGRIGIEDGIDGGTAVWFELTS